MEWSWKWDKGQVKTPSQPTARSVDLPETGESKIPLQIHCQADNPNFFGILKSTTKNEGMNPTVGFDPPKNKGTGIKKHFAKILGFPHPRKRSEANTKTKQRRPV
jgi:hypothetical protein